MEVEERKNGSDSDFDLKEEYNNIVKN